MLVHFKQFRDLQHNIENMYYKICTIHKQFIFFLPLCLALTEISNRCRYERGPTEGLNIGSNTPSGGEKV